ncbi:MAG: tyrosine recombinase XerC [Gemmatimonadota bacterium]|nr:MAG: tyrosine recombinase XerC [Gemmatimonadota bacterium]
MLLTTAARRFLTQLEADGRSPLTVSVYRGELGRFTHWAGSRKHAEAIRPDTIAGYMTDPASRVSPDGTARSTRTVNRTRTVIRLFFGYLVDRGTLRQSPARLLRNGRTGRPIPTVLSRDEEREIRGALDLVAKKNEIGRRDRVLFTLLLRSGMRLTAALALDVQDLDLAQCTATSRSGKNGRTQEVFLTRDVVRLLTRHLKAQAATTGPVFRSSLGRRLSARQAQYRFRELLVSAGIERPVTVHSLRHTFATRLREKTGDLRVVQVALGHRHLGTTEVYASVSDRDVQRAISR